MTFSELPGTGTKKYNEIIRAAKDLFWKHGFRRVSVEEICQKADASKMTFYRFFPNKIELAKSVFDVASAEITKKFRDLLSSDVPPAEKIRKMVLIELEGARGMSREFLQDFYSREPELQMYVEVRMRTSWNEILTDFKAAQKRGEIRSDVKPEFILYIGEKMSDMVADEKLVAMYASPQEMIGEVMNFFAYGISPTHQSAGPSSGQEPGPP